MRLYAVVCIVLTVGLLGHEALRAQKQRAAARVLVNVERIDADLAPVSSVEPEPIPARPGLLAFLTLGAAVLGTVSTISDAGSFCTSEACLSASIVDKTAELHAAATAPFAPATTALAQQ